MVLEATDERMDRLQLTTLCGLSRLAALGRLADNRQLHLQPWQCVTIPARAVQEPGSGIWPQKCSLSSRLDDRSLTCNTVMATRIR
jgi:hypothetical protein